MDKRFIYIIVGVVIVLEIVGYATGWYGRSTPPPMATTPPPAATAPTPATPAPTTPAQ
jgi:hypothetical protein